MALALYRRYRPDSFDGVIGQDQVTIPLMRALDEGKLTHAYLFSGPRGCGKTSSARILARCINCVKGPTSHPCGECESCKDLATGGPGSIDVVEIDAASHNGVDDARELRERAGFAPARDRYKIFILDEAHMVTQQGFNALLKIVEEPPEHVMFIFATTEPDKVIGTIRSRTHHYPFRLVPQEIMGPYLEQICEKEGVKAEPGVLKLAMRAGGGSMRDTLSVLDQLMVGAVDGVITHDASVALLGFTPEELIGQAIDAVIDRDGEALYAVIQKVVVGGFDPRRFVEDLLARVRDLLVLTLAGERAESVLSDDAEGVALDELKRQASALGLGPLSGMADTINTALGSMSGATSPRMRLELLAARLLAGRENGSAVAAANAPIAAMPGVGQTPSAASPATGASGVGAGTAGGFAGAARHQRHVASGAGAASAVGGFAGAARNQTAASGPSVSSGSGASAASTETSESSVAGAPTASDASAWPVPSVAGVESQSGQPSTAESAQPSSTVDARQSGASASRQSATQSTAQAAASTQTTSSLQPSASANDGRTPDERWDALVAALPEDVRRYVGRDKLPRIKLDGNPQAGRARLWLKFDVPLSKYAFAMGMAAEPVDGATKVVDIVRAAVRKDFGPSTSIAPTNKMANGEVAPPLKQLPVEEQQRIKAKLLQDNLGAAALGTASGLAQRETTESANDKSVVPGDDDDNHRVGRPSDSAVQANVDDDPWGKPVVPPQAKAQSETQQAQQAPVSQAQDDDDDPWAHPIVPANPAPHAEAKPQTHAHKHVAVPDMSNDDDPWAQPLPTAASSTAPTAQPSPAAGSASPVSPQTSTPSAAPTSPAPTRFGSAAAGMRSAAYVPPAGDMEPNAAPQYDDDPWKDVPPPSEPESSGASEASPDPWQRPASAAVPQATGGNPSPQQNTANPSSAGGDEDEYSMNDESLGAATAMSVDDLRKLFDVKQVEQFAPDDPRNPRNIQHKTHGIGEE